MDSSLPKVDNPISTATRKITHIDCILEPKDGVGGLYLGSLRGAQDVITLLDLKINSVLTVAAGTRLRYDVDLMANHTIIPAEDDEEYDLAKDFEEAIEFISETIKSGNVFVHCFAGVSRSATIVLAYLIYELKMELQAALKHVKERRWIVNPNAGFLKQLADFEKKLRLKPSAEDPKDQTLTNE